MAEKPDIINLSLTENLAESLKTPTSMSLPLALQYRLDVLATLTKRIKASRAEIVCMLIANADLDRTVLESQILEYRDRLVRDVVPQDSGKESGDVLSFRPRKPGRPRKAG